MEISKTLLLIRGAGDTASGTARRLFLAGFRVMMTELPEPLCIRRAVSFAEAVYEGRAYVEEVEGRLVRLEELAGFPWDEAIPIVVDPEGGSIQTRRPDILVDARILKRNAGTRMDQASIVAALGPGYTAGLDCHFVVETERGHNLGRVIYQGAALPDSGKPAPVMGHAEQRAIYSASSGVFDALVNIGDDIPEGTPVGRIGEELLISKISGTVRGILRSGLKIQKKLKVADIDPRRRPEFCRTVSDRTNAIAGGVLEGVLTLGERFHRRKIREWRS